MSISSFRLPDKSGATSEYKLEQVGPKNVPLVDDLALIGLVAGFGLSPHFLLTVSALMRSLRPNTFTAGPFGNPNTPRSAP
jgi:hypothetical protein